MHRASAIRALLAIVAVAAATAIAVVWWGWHGACPPGNWSAGDEQSGPEMNFPARAVRLPALVSEIPQHPCQFTPALEPIPIAQDLSNVNGLHAKLLGGWSSAQKQKLAANGFLVATEPGNDFYGFYTANPAPFITADSVFHVYHVIFADTLAHLERLEVIPLLHRLCQRAHENMKKLYDATPSQLRPGLREALLYWTVAASLCDAGAAAHSDVAKDAAGEVGKIQAGAGDGKFLGALRDYTAFRPAAGYEKDALRSGYFRANRYLTLTPLKYDTDPSARTALAVSLAAFCEAEAWRDYAHLGQVWRFLAGSPEDPSPVEALEVCRNVFGQSVNVRDLGDPFKLALWRSQLDKLFAPVVADQPQDKPGAAPVRGVRLLCPGVSTRALAFQAAEGNAMEPRGEHVLQLLGNPAAGLTAPEQVALAGAAQEFSNRRVQFYKALDLHSASLHVLGHLSGPWGNGFPGFMRSEGWQLKSANCQLGAWSEVEHDLFLYEKDNRYYACITGYRERFHGYVEPVPQYYADLASLVWQTRALCEALGLFERMTPAPPADIGPLARDVLVPTAKHYRTLEELLLKLKRMAEKELEDKDFDADEIELLKKFGQTLKYLSFDESNKSDADEPMSTVVRLVSEYLKRTGWHAGVGRPLWIGVIVPWKGKLYWATGAAYSYYQFKRPLAEPLDDTAWKVETSADLPNQREKPWLFGRGVGLDTEVWDEARFTNWLPKESQHFGSSVWGSGWRGPLRSHLGSLGFVTLDQRALEKAADAFARGLHGQETRATLFAWLKDAPAQVRQKAGVEALRTVHEKTFGKARERTSMDYSLWGFLALSLLEGTPFHAQAEAAGVPMEALRTAFRDMQEPDIVGWRNLYRLVSR